MACKSCGGSEARKIDVMKDGAMVAAGEMCSVCLGRATAEAAELREQFDELIAQGIDRRMANRIMTVRVDRRFAGG